MGERGEDRLSVVFGALADPTRRAILERLAEGEATVNELAEPFELSLPAISKHLKVLQRAGLVEQGRQAQWRPCRLRPEPLREVAVWMERYRAFLGESFDRLDAYLRTLPPPSPAARPVPGARAARAGPDPSEAPGGPPGAEGPSAPPPPRRPRGGEDHGTT